MSQKICIRYIRGVILYCLLGQQLSNYIDDLIVEYNIFLNPGTSKPLSRKFGSFSSKLLKISMTFSGFKMISLDKHFALYCIFSLFEYDVLHTFVEFPYYGRCIVVCLQKKNPLPLKFMVT